MKSKLYISEEDIEWLSPYSGKDWGLGDVIIWFGHSTDPDPRVFLTEKLGWIANQPGIAITVTEHIITGDVEAPWLNEQLISQIKEFLTRNRETILAYNQWEMLDGEFMDRVV